jgi:hypothetical protein
MRYAVVTVVAILSLGAIQPAMGSLPCGPRPEVGSGALATQLKGDIENTANLIHHAPPSPNLRRFVTAQRRELRQKYPSIERPALDVYLVWATCQTISKDPTLASSQGFDEYANFYRLLTEPIDKAAPATE